MELYPDADLFMVVSESGCINGQMKTFDQVLQEQGYFGTPDESLELFQQEPGQHAPSSVWTYAPGNLNMIEEWLRNL